MIGMERFDGFVAVMRKVFVLTEDDLKGAAPSSKRML